MKVVYEKSISSRIIEYKHKAKAENKTIEHIILSDKEAILLYDGLNRWGSTWLEDEAKVKELHNSNIYGITLKVEGLL